ncbi:TPA: tail length tape measure protein, partial [Pseudomonas aeruginosa]|nr:tail length tape measure protein [Pseudomonas aeruginosa]HCE6992622.1 tail length tape measure protein [Pseudomonas aeruginosa]
FGQGEQDTSMVTGAAAVTSAAGALAAAGGTLVTGAAALQSAAGSLALANGVKGAGVAASGAGAAGAAGAAAGGSGWWSSITSMFGFASGGHIKGPGTGTSDSIPILASNDEFMTRAAVVRQPGALAFLEQFNRYGMAALSAWANPVRHATGGLMGTPAPAMPAPGLAASRLQEPAKNLSATLKNNQNFYLVDDPSRIGDVMAGRYGDEAMVLHISRDPQKFRQLLGIN